MKITENRQSNTSSRQLPVRIMSADGKTDDRTFAAMDETVVSVFIDGTFACELPCSPDSVPELVAGWTVATAGVTADEIDEITIRDGNDAEHRPEALVTTKKGTGSGCMTGRTSGKVFSSLDMSDVKNWQWIYDLQERFDTERPLRKTTGASHSCMLVKIQTKDNRYDDLEILYQSEDAGRHSAMDKAIGWGIIRGIDMNGCILFTSGRISSAMVQKAVNGGVSALATAKPLVTTGAVEIARRNGLLLAGIDPKTKDIHIFA